MSDNIWEERFTVLENALNELYSLTNCYYDNFKHDPNLSKIAGIQTRQMASVVKLVNAAKVLTPERNK